MIIHIIQDRKLCCGAKLDSEKSFVPLSLYLNGDIKPVGDTRYCPFCLGALKDRV